MRFSRATATPIHPSRKVIGAACATAAIVVTGLMPVVASGTARAAGHGATARTANGATTVFPGCAWPVETTPDTADVAAPDPYATYWTTPFLANPRDTITITGRYPKSRFMSISVYNSSFQLFTNTVRGKKIPSDLSDYQITADAGSANPWRTGRVVPGARFTVRIRAVVTAARQRAENAIPMIDQNPPPNPAGPPGLGYVIFRVYIPAGGNSTVRLPVITITHNGKRTTLPQCGSRIGQLGPAVAARTGSGSGEPQLRYFGPSADSQAGLFPNAVNAYLVMEFTPRKGYVVVTRGQAPTSPVTAGHGVPGNSVGAYPVPWLKPEYQVRYWSIANYLNHSPYPVVKVGRGSKAIFGGTPDYLTTVRNGYYLVVSSTPADKPSAAALRAAGATWIPTSAAKPTAPEFQLLRNMLSQRSLYPRGFTFIPPPADPAAGIPPATVERFMGAYYPRVAQCAVATFEAGGWTACLAATFSG